MRKIFYSVLILLGISITASAQQANAQKFEYPSDIPQSLNISAERLAYIDRILQENVDNGTLPQALTFVAKNGVVIHNKAFGWNDIESKTRLKKDDVFRNYSQTKAITSAALLTLYEQGKFQLNDPVSKYIPECTNLVLEKMNPDGTYTTREAASPITIRHLLSHTSGILGNRDVHAIRQEQLKKRGNKPYETLAQEVKDLVQYPLAFDPGTDWNYHPATDVCGYLVEYFSGKSLRDYVKETILIPLEMKDTDWYYPESYRKRMITAYTQKDGKLIAQPDVWSGRDPFSADTRYCQAGSGLNGTIDDYARFCQMILNGGTFNGKRILGRRTIELMCTDQLPQPNKGGVNFHFGLGFQLYPEVLTDQQKDVISYTPMVSPGSLHWKGYYNTNYMIDPKEGLVIMLYTNIYPNPRVWEKFLNTVYQALQ